MALYSLAGAKPAPLPFRILLPDGRSRTDPSGFTATEIAAAGYVEATDPPAHDPDTEQLVWNGEWSVEPLPLAELQAALQIAIRERRWQAEIGGALVNGVLVRTDETSQTKIAGAIALFDKNPSLTSIDFEAQPGEWVTLDAAAMTAIGVAVGMHIQTCFSNARALSEAVDAAASPAALAAIDIEAGWP